MLTFEQIKELIELVGKEKLQGLEITRSGFSLRIDGNVTILCETSFDLGPFTVVELLPGATLDVYVKGTINIKEACQVNLVDKGEFIVVRDERVLKDAGDV